MMFIKYQKIVASFIIDICDKYEGGITFKADIIQSGERQFTIDLHRRDIFSLRPHGEQPDVLADKIFWLWANEVLIDDKPCQSIEACMQKINDSLEAGFELEKLDIEDKTVLSIIDFSGSLKT